MAYSYVKYNGDGLTSLFSVPFPYLEKAHVSVQVFGTSVPFTWISSGQISLGTAPAVGTGNVKILRTTPSETVTFTTPTNFRSDVLNVAFKQLLYVTQEAYDKASDALATGADVVELLDSLSEQIARAEVLVPLLAEYTTYYFGAGPSVPSGTSYPTGSRFFNTSDLRDYVWSGTGWVRTTPKWLLLSATGDGSNKVFTLGSAPSAAENVFVFVGGVKQGVSTYSISGSTLTFSAAPPSGSWVEIISGAVVTADETATAVSSAAASATSASASASSAAASADKAASAAASVSSLPPFRNLLINTDFADPINQRSYTSGTATTAANQYTLDRWRVVVSGQALTWAGGVITAPAGGLEQVVEGKLIPRSGVYTLSWTGTATATVDGAPVANGGTVTLTKGTNVIVRFSGGTVQSPQLEYGATVTAWEALPYDVVLTRCMRYFELVLAGPLGSGFGYSSSSVLAYCVATFKTRKRASPSLTYSSVGALYVTSTGAGQNSTSISLYQSGSDAAALAAGVASISAGVGVTVAVDANHWIAFSAEL